MTSARDNAISLARHDPKAAMERARRIADPWFRCQALAWVAWLTPDDSASLKAAGAALDAAWCAPDPYQAAGAAAWPIRSLAERGRSVQARAATRKALGVTVQIENPVSRADALFLLFQATLGHGATSQVVRALVEACSEAKSWKGQHILRDVALMLAADDQSAADQVVAVMSECRERRQAERRIKEGQSMPPRAFFWRNPKGPVE